MSNNHAALKDVLAQGPTLPTRAIQEQEQTSPNTHCGLDSMSNIPCIPLNVATYLKMSIEVPKRELRFGSYSHDGTVGVTQIAKDIESRYLPTFAL